MSNNDPRKKQKVDTDNTTADMEMEDVSAADADVRKRSVHELLTKMSNESETTGIWKLQTKTVYQNANGDDRISDKDAFYMKREGEYGISFRHEGNSDKSPQIVYLEAYAEWDKLFYKSVPSDDGKVALYYSASGSGKTVELAASSVTRHADLALLVTLDRDVTESEIDDKLKDDTDPTKDRKTKRNEISLGFLCDAIKELLRNNSNEVLGPQNHWSSFVEILKAQPEEGLTVVVGIDEASSCPTVVRSIISVKPATASRALRQFVFQKLMENKDARESREAHKMTENLKFIFSIAGTGAASSTIGSDSGRFEHNTPSAANHSYLYPRMALKEREIKLCLPGGIYPSVITLESIEKSLPILHCMIENARMASIALKELRDRAKSYIQAIVEKAIVDTVCRLFIRSNGLWLMSDKPITKSAVGACAFAMMLFQEDTPVFGSTAEKERYFSNFSCGLDFDLGVTKMFEAHTQEAARKILVAKFGLLEPTYDTTETTKSFVMQPSQQLIALNLLGIELSQLVRADPYGFEVLSTHTMKAALAASSVVAWEGRKSVKETLESVGCMVDKNGTDPATKTQWEELGDFFVVRHTYEKRKFVTPTRLLNAELEVFTRDNKKFLYIEKAYRKDLAEAIADMSNDSIFHPPITAVNYGSSALADGFITCLIAKNEGTEIESKKKSIRFSPMNQAKDKLGYSGKPKGPMPVSKLRAHAERCSDPILNKLFGEKRLLFVSTPTSQRFVKREKSLKVLRPWLPRALDQCKILENLMATLSSRRTKQYRQELHTDCVDEDGNTVCDESSSDEGDS